MSSRVAPMLLAITLTCTACAGANKKNNDWDIDYSKVYKAAGERDVDRAYKAPSVLNCVDDDLFNCK